MGNLIAVSIQHENWKGGDSGSDHDPIIINVSDQEFAYITTLALKSANDEEFASEEFAKELRSREILYPTYPLAIAWCGTVWWA